MKSDVHLVFDALVDRNDGATCAELEQATGFTYARVNQGLKQLLARKPAYALVDPLDGKWRAAIPGGQAKFCRMPVRRVRDSPSTAPKPAPKPKKRLPEVEAVVETMTTLISKYEDLVNALAPAVKLLEEQRRVE